MLQEGPGGQSWSAGPAGRRRTRTAGFGGFERLRQTYRGRSDREERGLGEGRRSWCWRGTQFGKEGGSGDGGAARARLSHP